MSHPRPHRRCGKTDGPVIKLPQDIGYIAFFTDTEGNRDSLTNG